MEVVWKGVWGVEGAEVERWEEGSGVEMARGGGGGGVRQGLSRLRWRDPPPHEITENKPQNAIWTPLGGDPGAFRSDQPRQEKGNKEENKRMSFSRRTVVV